MIRTHLVCAVLLFTCTGALAESPELVARQAALEKKFEETLTNAVLVGTFTMKGEQNKGKLHEERYVISSVKKQQDEFWLFNARIQYGKHDVTLPLLFEVKWAGDTPVITLDKMKIPGFGTFTARVLIYDNQYVGTWDGGDHGGQMFGRIERLKPGETDKPKAATEPASVEVILKAAGEQKIQIVKIIREETGLGLKESKDLIDNAPQTIKKGISAEAAEKIARRLREHGAEVEIK